jgi:transposase
MALHPQDFSVVPEETARVARTAFPKDNPYLILRDKLGVIYQDNAFVPLFASSRGRPAESPGRLALVTALQFAENLSDRQAADAVRGRIDWKYLLGLELTDPGFHYSVLCDFRRRVLENGAERQLLDALLQVLKAQRLIKARGKQRTDSTHVLAAIHDLNRLERVGETLRYALNSLAVVVPGWLRERVPAAWFERYGERFEQWRLPERREEQQQLAVTIGQDGRQLWQWLCAPTTPAWLRDIPAVETCRRVWVQEFYEEEDQVRLRQAEKEGLPPAHLTIVSPYDTEAHYSIKRRTEWCGYKVHLTETCEDDLPLLITNVETTLSPTPDVTMTEPIHQRLQAKDLSPGAHLVDAGYVDARALAESPVQYGVRLIGPAPADYSWQARAGQGFALSDFAIDWDRSQVTCPQGHTSVVWGYGRDRRDEPVVHVLFAKEECRRCSVRAQCTRSKTAGRVLTFRPQEQYLALQDARQRQTTPEFRQEYARRAGVEGTISQATRRCGLRRSRYFGLAKTQLQHIVTAIAINLVRLADWFAEVPRAQTRCSRFAALSPT